MKQLKSDRGIAIIYVTLFLMVLGLLFFALGIDAGWLTYVRSQGQTAVDASALAGAAGIPKYNKNNSRDTSAIYPLATTALNSSNTVMNQEAGIADSDVELCPADAKGNVCTSCCAPGTPAPPVNGVKVSRPYQPRTFFSRLLGAGNNANVTVSSVAWLGGPVEVDTRSIVPIALRKCKVSYPNDCGLPTIIQSPDSDKKELSDNSAFTTINLTGGAVCKQLAKGDEPSGIINTITANETRINLVGSGQVTDCLKTLDKKYETCTKEDCRMSDDPDNPTKYWKAACMGTVPIVDTGCPGAQTSDMSSGLVVGFATICFTNITVPPDDKLIEAALVCDKTYGGNTIGGGVFYGTYADRPVLVK